MVINMTKNYQKNRRKQRQEEARERQLIWAGFTNAQKLEQLTARGFGESDEAKKYLDTEPKPEVES